MEREPPRLLATEQNGHPLTEEEYLRSEQSSPVKREYIDGRVNAQCNPILSKFMVFLACLVNSPSLPFAQHTQNVSSWLITIEVPPY